MDIDDLYSGQGTMVVMRSGNKMIGIVGSGSTGDQSPVGTTAHVKIDNMQGRYRFLSTPEDRANFNDPSTWTVVALAPVTKEAVRKHRVRALYHFD
jgi:hypothetical protein